MHVKIIDPKTHSEHNNEDSMEELSEQEDPSDHKDGVSVW